MNILVALLVLSTVGLGVYMYVRRLKQIRQILLDADISGVDADHRIALAMKRLQRSFPRMTEKKALRLAQKAKKTP